MARKLNKRQINSWRDILKQSTRYVNYQYPIRYFERFSSNPKNGVNFDYYMPCVAHTFTKLRYTPVGVDCGFFAGHNVLIDDPSQCGKYFDICVARFRQR